MAELIMEMPAPYEPMRTNRWLINMGGGNVIKEIPKYLFTSYKIITEEIPNKNRQGTKLELKMTNKVGFLAIPDMFMDEKSIIIDYLDPTGLVIESYNMDVIFDHFEMAGDYGDSSLLTAHISFWVKSIRTNQTDEIDKEAVEAYKKRNEEKNGEGEQ